MEELNFTFKMPDDETLAKYISIKGEKGEKGDPTKLSELDNDTGFVTASTSELTNYYTKTQTDGAIETEAAAIKTELGVPAGFFTDAIETVTGEGSLITLNDTANAVFKDIKLYGDTLQENSPTPDSPVAVQVITGDQTVIITDNGQQSQSYTVSLGDIKLLAIDEAKDYIYNSGDKWYKHKAIDAKKLASPSWQALNGNASGYNITSSNGAFVILNSASGLPAPSGKILSNYMKWQDQTVGGNAAANSMIDKTFVQRSGTNDRIYYRNTDLIGKTGYELTEMVQDQEFYYILAAPVEEEITDQTLIKQLNALCRSVSYEGITTVSSSGSLPAIFSVEAFKNNWSGTISGLNEDINKLPIRPATESELGMVKVGDGLNVTETGELSTEMQADDYYTKGEIDKALSIDDTYYFDTHFALTTYGGGSQGGCALPDGSIIQFTGQGTVKKYDSNGTLISTASAPYGHCNGACYCSKTGTVFVTSSQDNTIGKYKVFEIDSSTLELLNTYDGAEVFPATPYGIVYSENDDEFIFVNWWGSSATQYSWKTDTNFSLISGSVKTYNFVVDSTSYFGKFGAYLAVEDISNHKIMMFDYDMNFVQTSKLHDLVGDTWMNTETEWFDTVDGVVYINFVAGYSGEPHRGGLYVYGKCDLLNNYPVTKQRDPDVITPHREIYYVDHTTTRLDRDGSSSKPFMTIYEAINSSLRTENVTGSVTITIRNTSSNTHYPIFTMPKSYRINYNPSGSIEWFRGIAVDAGCEVTFNKGVTIVPYETKQNPFSFGSGGDLCVMGRLIVSGEVTNNDNSSLVISGSDSAYIKLGVTNNGITVTDYWGELEDCNIYRKTSGSLVTGLVQYGYKRSRDIRIMNYQLTAVDGVFTVPYLARNMQAYIRYIVDNNTFEISVPVTVFIYQKIPVFYDSTLRTITIDNDGTVTGTNVTIDRVIIHS